MNTAATSNNDVPPVICTLTVGKLEEQRLEWDDLRPLAVSRTPIDGGVTSIYPIELADRIADLANRETSCCGSWLTIEQTRTVDHTSLTLTTTNPEGVAIIRAMSGLAPSPDTTD